MKFSRLLDKRIICYRTVEVAEPRIELDITDSHSLNFDRACNS